MYLSESTGRSDDSYLLRDIFADTRTKDGNNGTKITLLPLFNDGRDQ